jgi:hemolysin activation/secretion protein
MTYLAHQRPTVLATAVLALFASSALAAGPSIDAGSLLRQAEQELKAPKPARVRPARKAKPNTLIKPSETTVRVSRFQFTGNSLLSNEVLSQAVSSFTDRSLSLAQLKEAADAITTAYREAGWTVRAYLPKQEINGGVVTIQIVETVFGTATLQGQPPQRVDAARLLEMAQALLPKGQPMHANDVDRALLLLDDLPGVTIAGNLIEGQHDGETDLLISAVDDPLLTGNASIDNQGGRATGTDRLNYNLNLNSPSRFGDALSLNGLATQGSEYQRIGYTVPVGNQGWRAGLHVTNLRYKVITPEFESLDAHGTAFTSGWDINYPLVRSQTHNIYFALSYDDKKFDNSSGNTLNNYGIRAYNTSLNFNQLDNWAGGGSSNAGITLTAGEKGTASSYTKLNLNLSRLQSVTDSLSVYAAAGAQATNRNLDSSEKMYLGGATGVRAYPASEAGGSQGSTFTLELRQRVAQNLTLTGFYDYGRIRLNHDNHLASPASPNSYDLQGYGFSLAWQPTQNVDIKATLAHRMGTNPAAQANGTDADGTQKLTRLWVSAGIAF